MLHKHVISQQLSSSQGWPHLSPSWGCLASQWQPADLKVCACGHGSPWWAGTVHFLGVQPHGLLGCPRPPHRAVSFSASLYLQYGGRYAGGGRTKFQLVVCDAGGGFWRAARPPSIYREPLWRLSPSRRRPSLELRAGSCSARYQLRPWLAWP